MNHARYNWGRRYIWEEIYNTNTMRQVIFLKFFLGILLACLCSFKAKAEDPYRYYTWEVTYGTIYPLGVPQKVG